MDIERTAPPSPDPYNWDLMIDIADKHRGDWFRTEVKGSGHPQALCQRLLVRGLPAKEVQARSIGRRTYVYLRIVDPTTTIS